MFLAELLISTFTEKSADYLGVIAVLKDISKDFNDNKTGVLANQTLDLASSTRSIVNLIYMVAIVYVAVAAVIVALYIRYVRKGYVYLSRFITFLT